MSKVSEGIRELQKAMEEEGVNPVNGLPLDLFEFNVSLLPFVNVDLIIQNNKGQILSHWCLSVRPAKGALDNGWKSHPVRS